MEQILNQPHSVASVLDKAGDRLATAASGRDVPALGLVAARRLLRRGLERVCAEFPPRPPALAGVSNPLDRQHDHPGWSEPASAQRLVDEDGGSGRSAAEQSDELSALQLIEIHPPPYLR
jgi:hypothetical protein